MKLSLRSILIIIVLAAASASGTQAQWSQVNGLDTTLTISSIASSGSDIYTCEGELYISPDDGLHWQDEGTFGMFTLAARGPHVFGASLWDGLHILADTGNAGAVFCCWQGENDVWSRGSKLFFSGEHYGMNISNDSGRTWQTVTAGIVPVFGFDSLFIGSDSLNHVFRSTDPGVTWSPVTGLPDSPYYAITMSATGLVATNYTTMFRSTDGGRTWANAGNGLPGVSIHVLASNANAVFAATGSGVYLSTNDGLNWRNWNGGLGGATVTCFTINDTYIFAGTQGQGVWRRALSELSSVSPLQRATDITVSPNPTTSIVTIHSVPEDLESISIVNVLGERVMEVAHPDRPDLTLDLSTLPPGLYDVNFYSMSSFESRKVIKW